MKNFPEKMHALLGGESEESLNEVSRRLPTMSEDELIQLHYATAQRNHFHQKNVGIAVGVMVIFIVFSFLCAFVYDDVGAVLVAVCAALVACILFALGAYIGIGIVPITLTKLSRIESELKTRGYTRT